MDSVPIDFCLIVSILGWALWRPTQHLRLCPGCYKVMVRSFFFFLFRRTTEIKNNFLGKMGTGYFLVRKQYYMVALLKEWTWEITAEHDLTAL